MGPRAHWMPSQGQRQDSDHVVLPTLTLGQLTPARVAQEKKPGSRENQSASLHQLIFSRVIPERPTPSHGTVVPAHSILIPGDEDETLEQPLNPHLMAPSPQGHKDEFGLLCGPQPLASSH
ncbi:hypothetical protein MG293_016832 [Ovis ammon polii]|uniref:Uncharacterized protein n=1 Tax=Ovis ammon polii TaxID=230172 RepID=A0AAD4TTT0_OVIAM|nr:hypothetical protein MG293_016832 [Ovis ammon polii]